VAQAWLKEFVAWLRRAIGFQVDRRPAVRITEEYHADGISVLRLDDASIPGCVDLWRIDRHHEGIKFFICLINLQLLREDLSLPNGRNALNDNHRRGLVNDLQQQINGQTAILATHYWITGWHRNYTGIDRNGKQYQSSRADSVACLAVDLQGVAGVFAGDRYARRYARRIIQQLAANEFRELERHHTWQAAVRAIDWAEWLSGLSRSTKRGISPDHVLQPLKPSRKKA
jgi:hypothetical protein